MLAGHSGHVNGNPAGALVNPAGALVKAFRTVLAANFGFTTVVEL